VKPICSVLTVVFCLVGLTYGQESSATLSTDDAGRSGWYLVELLQVHVGKEDRNRVEEKPDVRVIIEVNKKTRLTAEGQEDNPDPTFNPKEDRTYLKWGPGVSLSVRCIDVDGWFSEDEVVFSVGSSTKKNVMWLSGKLLIVRGEAVPETGLPKYERAELGDTTWIKFNSKSIEEEFGKDLSSDKAIKSVEPLLEENKPLHEVYSKLSDFFYAGNDFKKALEAMSRAIDRYNGNDKKERAKLHRGVASVLYEMKEFGGAARHYRKSCELDPDNWISLWNLGRSLEKSGDWSLAKKAFQQGLSRAETDKDKANFQKQIDDCEEHMGDK
jgi:tetratricopeptide (TPR) repeat protein